MRLQLALNVDDIDQAVDFYSRLFGAEPAKRRDGYANFAIDEPPLKLVLFESPGHGGTINHLGVETTSDDEVFAAQRRLAAAGLETTGVDETMCCYADKVETWVTDPAGVEWEWYVKSGDNEVRDNVVVASPVAASSDAACCAAAS
ncbi:ArsI/CadI family heavy metal resistance metalloenzyme [Candidatus Poriferisodalis sp.]|uniref:ArsI/CadI family heavy metal resistance metalloenzyme n=1 Tax=Candidatus Poriferisodalis sp. TaxID=3101277 RepID=UPI003C6EC83C